MIAWYAESGRRFPWRLPREHAPAHTGEPLHDPYMILVAEVMLQQTGTARVVEKLPAFLEQFPTVEALATAPVADLIRAWKGMGYNRRVLNLQRAAREIVARFDGLLPPSVELLESLPGIGRYTASAVCAFAFGRPVPVVDVNIARLLGRIFQKCHSDMTRVPYAMVWRIDEAIVPRDDAYRWHQALMDLGATLCLPSRPLCSACPVAADCLSAYPTPIALFDPRRAVAAEPLIRDIPRRIWRGRVVEALRERSDGVRLGDLLDQLLPAEAESGDRRLLHAVVERLRSDGLVASHGAVREGYLEEGDLIGLPL
jgi:A/G-specific adenine glycosylase